ETATGYHHHGVRSTSRYSGGESPPREARGGVRSAPGFISARGALPGMGGASQLEVLVRRLDAGAGLPAYALPGDAGADIVTTVDVVLAPGERAVVPTGIAIAMPDGYAAFVHPRSGLAARAGMSLVNAPGTIDSGYRGEIKVIVINHDPVAPIVLRRGDRIAQLVIQRVEMGEFVEADVLPASQRGT